MNRTASSAWRDGALMYEAIPRVVRDDSMTCMMTRAPCAGADHQSANRAGDAPGSPEVIGVQGHHASDHDVGRGDGRCDALLRHIRPASRSTSSAASREWNASWCHPVIAKTAPSQTTDREIRFQSCHRTQSVNHKDCISPVLLIRRPPLVISQRVR